MVMNALSGLLGGAMPKAGGIAPGREMQPSQVPFKSVMQITDGDAAYDTAAEIYAIINAGTANVPLKLWEATVPAQQKIRWGFGSPAFDRNQGYMWFFLLDSGAGFQTGKMRLKIANARETKVFTVAETDESRLHLADNTSAATATPTNIDTGMMALPEKVEHPKLGEDSLLQIWMTPTVAVLTTDAAGFSIPITVYQ